MHTFSIYNALPMYLNLDAHKNTYTNSLTFVVTTQQKIPGIS